MSSPIQNNLASLIAKLKGPGKIPTIPKVGAVKNGSVGIQFQPARIKQPHIVGGKILKPRIRIRIMQNALQNQLGKGKP